MELRLQNRMRTCWPSLATRGGRGREDFGVEGEYVEVSHFIWIGPRRAGNDLPFAEYESEVAVGSRSLGMARMDDKKPHEAEGHLCHFIVVGMVHMGAMLFEGKLIFERVARLDGLLGEAGNAVHAVGQENSMPMNGGGRG